ncbi:GFA family protein [Paucibacter sp. KCTC 42545]|uniref:GFA family protein n=1 Tax=Paucibacter sp. KCTC 42545 TaxID=1768242 RepID=UPI0009EB432C
MLSGSCLCQSVRYTVASAIEHAENCHCSMCRKAHGAAFSSNALVPTGALTIAGSAHLTAYRSSQNREKLFCSKCGSQLFIRRLNAPEGTVITLGTLDSDPKISPSRNVFVGSKAPWYELDADLPSYKVYPGFEPDE